MKHKIKITSIEECRDSKYITTKRIFFDKDDEKRSWDILKSHDSTSILILDKSKNCLVLVKQFRPSVFLENNDGYIYESCSGLIDKEGKNIEQIAREEVLEECGYDAKSLEYICELYSAVGFSGSKISMFFTIVTSEDRISEGGGIEDEDIEVIFLPVEEIEEFLYDKNKPKTTTLAFLLEWFLKEKV